MTWNILGMLAAGLIPALTIINVIAAAIEERRHPRPPDDQGWAH